MRKPFRTVFSVALCAAAMYVLGACGEKSANKVVNAVKNGTDGVGRDASVTSGETVANVGSPCPPQSDFTIGFVNTFFPVDTLDLVERSATEQGPIPASRQVDMGGKVGLGRILITADIVPQFQHAGQTYNLYEGTENPEYSVASVKAVDLDGDGLKELLVHNGDMFDLYVYGLENGKPELKGNMMSNSEFFITSDRTIVARLGSQGLCSLAHYSEGKLTVSEEEGISRLMFASKDYANLRYDFDECSEDTVARLLDTEHYAVTHQGMAVLHADLDGDGTKEQIAFQYAEWGAVMVDQLAIIHNNDELDLLSMILDTNDTVGIVEDEDCWLHVEEPIQLSDIDCDCDGVSDLVVTIGRPHDNVSYVFKLDKQGMPQLIKHFRLNRKPTKQDALVDMA